MNRAQLSKSDAEPAVDTVERADLNDHSNGRIRFSRLSSMRSFPTDGNLGLQTGGGADLSGAFGECQFPLQTSRHGKQNALSLCL